MVYSRHKENDKKCFSFSIGCLFVDLFCYRVSHLCVHNLRLQAGVSLPEEVTFYVLTGPTWRAETSGRPDSITPPHRHCCNVTRYSIETEQQSTSLTAWKVAWVIFHRQYCLHASSQGKTCACRWPIRGLGWLQGNPAAYWEGEDVPGFLWVLCEFCVLCSSATHRDCLSPTLLPLVLSLAAWEWIWVSTLLERKEKHAHIAPAHR